MKRKRILSIESKNNNITHPIQLVFNYIDDPFTFQKCSLICKTWKKILDSHPFWEKIVEEIGLEKPKSKARKYKTYKLIFIKNFDKICSCQKGIKIHQKSIDEINFKLRILKRYCDYKLQYKIYKFNYTYRNLILFVKEKIDILINSSYSSIFCNKCNKEKILLDSVKNLINRIYKRCKIYEKTKKICKFVKIDLIKVINRNLYNIIDGNTLYIEHFGGYVKNYNYTITNEVEYKDL
jgi:hypothetical protein